MMGGKPHARQPRTVTLANGWVIPDPAKPRVAEDMICMRCRHVGMLIVPGLVGKAVCLAGCPKPWYCTKCETEATGELGPPSHAPWCETAPAAAAEGE
jgi:hypothetical protein